MNTRNYLFLCLLWLGIGNWCVQPVAAQDSLYTLKQVQKIYLVYPDSALHLIDTMQERRLFPSWLLDAQRSLVYGGQQHFRLTLEYARAALENDSLATYPALYLRAISSFQEASRHAGEFRAGLAWLRKGIDFARIHKNPVAEVSFLYDSAQMYALMGDSVESQRYFQQSMQLAESGDRRLKPYLSFLYGARSRMLGDAGRYAEALALCQKRVELIRSMESMPNIPEGYLNQQYAYVYGDQSYWLVCLGREEEAEVAYRRFCDTPGSDHETNLELVVRYGMVTHQYERVAERIRMKLNEWEAREDLTPLTRVQYLSWLVKAYEKQGDYRQALQAHKEQTEWADTLQARQLREEVAEQAALYGLYEKDRIIQQQTLEARQATLRFYMLLAGLVVLCILLWVTYYHMRTVKRKNRLMVEKIGKLIVLQDRVDGYEQQIDELKTRLVASSPVKSLVLSASADVKEISESLPDLSLATLPDNQSPIAATVSVRSESDEPDYRLFKRIDQAVKEEQLYLNPDFGRQDLVERFGIDKNTFSRLIKVYTELSLPQYLANLRVKRAIQVLMQYPNYTLQAVSDESGFSNIRSFQRNFKAVTGMTPSEYRQASLGE